MLLLILMFNYLNMKKKLLEKYPNYYAFYTESWANKCAGLIVKEINGYYYTDFKENT